MSIANNKSKKNEFQTGENGDFSDIIIASIVFLVASGLIAFCILFSGKDQKEMLFSLLVSVFGSALGWIIGIYLSPYNAHEDRKFNEFARAITLFFVGFLFAKLDADIISAIRAVLLGSFAKDLYFDLFGFSIMFIVSVGVTYVTRQYWTVRK